MTVHPTFAYQKQNSSQTVQQALDEYYAKNTGLVNTSNEASEIAALFRHHDIIHVVFGCTTSLHDETLADTWTIFGTTIRLREYLNYLKYPEATNVLKQVGWINMFREFLKTIPDMFRVIGKTRQMTKKWVWTDDKKYLDQPLSQVRQEFGIQILR